MQFVLYMYKFIKFKCSNNYDECIKERFIKEICDQFKCKTSVPIKIFERGRPYELFLRITSVRNEHSYKTLIETFINGEFMKNFTIRNDFPIWTINRILVILNSIKVTSLI